MMMSGDNNSHQISLEYAEKRGRNRHLVEIIGTPKKLEPTSVYAAATNCLIQTQNLILALAGQVFIKP
jgi:hypothetical protein